MNLFALSLCSTVYSLSQYRSELCELSQLAWRGLESNKTLFMEEDISQDVLKFSVRTGLFSQVRHGRIQCVNVLCISVGVHISGYKCGRSYVGWFFLRIYMYGLIVRIR